MSAAALSTTALTPLLPLPIAEEMDLAPIWDIDVSDSWMYSDELTHILRCD